MSVARPIFFVSDGTGITAETMGHSLLTQFGHIAFETRRISFVDTLEKAQAAARTIHEAGERSGIRPIVINTVVNEHLTALLMMESGALMLDVFAEFLGPLEAELGVRRADKVNSAHSMSNYDAYEQRINATNYALTHDDGIDVHYDEADVILVGVSRSGKTPTCLYMALHHGVKAANYPLTDEDLQHHELPKRLRAHRSKLYGLTIDPVRLQQIRQQRKPGSRYADIGQCQQEVKTAEQLFRSERISALNTTHTSIEEISSKILSALGINRTMF